MKTDQVSIRSGKLQSLVEAVFDRVGCSKAEAQRVARYLVEANLTGHDSHGVVRVPRYVQMLRDEMIFANRDLKRLVDTPALAVVDGQFGFGQTVAEQATQIGIEKCRESGVAAIALRNSGHIGRVADWAIMAADAGLVSVHFVNAAGSVLVAPFGSSERRFSTAPFCVGVPVKEAAPLVLDFATSIVAEGKVLVASLGGKPLRPDALVGPDGKFGDDPHLLYGEYTSTGLRNPREGPGAIRSFGDHKGSGLAFMCEILGGGLSGNGCNEFGRRFSNGMFSFFVDPARVDPEALFPDEVNRYLAFVKQAKPIEVDGETLVPGEPEQRSRKQRLANGVPLSPDTWKSIVDTAREVGVTPDELAGLPAA